MYHFSLRESYVISNSLSPQPLYRPLPEGFEEYLPLQSASADHKQRGMVGPKDISDCEVRKLSSLQILRLWLMWLFYCLKGNLFMYS